MTSATKRTKAQRDARMTKFREQMFGEFSSHMAEDLEGELSGAVRDRASARWAWLAAGRAACTGLT